MFFVLPGRDGRPVETLRYEAMRQAAQDFELLKMAERRLPPNQAKQVIDEAYTLIFKTNLIKDFAEISTARAEDLYSLDPSDYQAARKVVLDVLSGKKGRP